MQNRWMRRGIAAGVCVAVVAALQWHAGSTTPVRGDAYLPVAQSNVGANASVLRVPALQGDTPQVFAFDGAAWDRAVHAGAMHVALPDGTHYQVRIERQVRDAFGHASLIGRVDTRFGRQSMVLTRGQGALFGALPTPDGRMLQIATTRGVTTIGVPRGALPPGAVLPNVAVPAPTMAKRPVASAAATALDDTPIGITVLGLYGEDIVALRGDEATVQTEIAQNLAVANQAHIDSGSRVRFTLVGTLAIHRDFADNAAALTWISYDDAHEKPIFDARNATSADLVSLLRVRGEDDDTCGAAYTTAGNMTRNSTQAYVGGVMDINGYSVVDAAPCGPYAMAHELGHNLGNAHDRLSEMAPWGEQRHGAYPFSFGYVREGAFATIMAESKGLPQLGVYSNPDIATCMGAPCGIADEADNVRSMHLVATQVAQFRDTPSALSIADAVAWEPAADRSYDAVIPLRYSLHSFGPWPVVQVRIVGGTAVAGVDYEVPLSGGVMEAQMANDGAVWLKILGDGVVDGDKTVELEIAWVEEWANITLGRTTATLTIHDSDPRPILRGHVRFAEGATPRTVFVKAYRAEGNRLDDTWSPLYAVAEAPDYAYEFPVVRGSSVRLEMEEGSLLWAHPVFVNHVLGDRRADLVVEHVVPVSFNMGVNQIFPKLTVMSRGWTYPSNPQPMLKILRGDRLLYTGSNTEVAVGQVLDEVTTETTVLIAESTEPLAYVYADRQSMGEGDVDTRDAVFEIRLAQASAAPVQVAYRTVDGTAKAGSDYVATSGTAVFAPGRTRVRVRVPVIGDATPEKPERFELEIRNPVGATLTSTRLHMTIADDDRRTGGPGQHGAWAWP